MDMKKVRIPLELPEDIKNAFIKKIESIYPKLGINPALRFIIHVMLNTTPEALKQIIDKGSVLGAESLEAENRSEELGITQEEYKRAKGIALESMTFDEVKLREDFKSLEKKVVTELLPVIGDIYNRLDRLEDLLE